MKFVEASLAGVYIIELEPFIDERGLFARTFCENEFKQHGLNSNMVQSNVSITYKKGTIRGMHYQVNGAEESKLIRCIKGKILDVIIDVRRESETFGNHFMIELDEAKHRMLYVPEGFAHGFLTMVDDCHLFYQVSNFYTAEKEKGIRWNDPVIGIKWPTTDPIISKKDAGYSDFKIKLR